MATRYYALQGSDINGALGVGIDTGSWLSTAYSVFEPIGVVIGAWLGIALSVRRMLLVGVVTFLTATVIPAHRAELRCLDALTHHHRARRRGDHAAGDHHSTSHLGAYPGTLGDCLVSVRVHCGSPVGRRDRRLGR